jgi:hypothetical protein
VFRGWEIVKAKACWLCVGVGDPERCLFCRLSYFTVECNGLFLVIRGIGKIWGWGFVYTLKYQLVYTLIPLGTWILQTVSQFMGIGLVEVLRKYNAFGMIEKHVPYVPQSSVIRGGC